MKYTFKNYIFDDSLQEVVLPSGERHKLRDQVFELLLTLVKQPEIPISKAELIEVIWGTQGRVTDHQLQGVVRDLRQVLRDSKKTLIRTIRYKGYFLDSEVGVHEAAHEAVPSSTTKASRVLPIFPGTGTPAGSLFVHSAANSGKNDYVKYIKRKVKWEARPRQMVVTSEDAAETIVIPFRHTLKEGSEDQSWWVAVVAVKVNIVTGDWEGTDVTEYNKLVFEARSIPTRFSSKERTMPLLVRLEDNDKNADGGSRRQSTDWYPQQILLPKAFITVALELKRFNWSAEAWYWNTRAVDRADVAQIIFGQDSRIPSLQGTIEIRNVRFEI